MAIYNELKDAGVPLDNHYSDLYAKVTPESRAIVNRHADKIHVLTFRHQVTGELWYDIAFAYLPYWQGVQDRNQPTR